MSRTFHIYQDDGQWVVKRRGWAPRLFATRKAAVEAAIKSSRKLVAAKVLVHQKDGTSKVAETHGLRKLPRLPYRGEIGRRNIEIAVNAIILAELKAESIPSRA